ncbi:MAG TPA: phosphopantetheine-binding protein [Aestuariivirgaceae bacterium]|jgi:acyl carrier protein
MNASDDAEIKRAEIFSSLCKLLMPFNYSGVELKPETDISADLSIDSVTVMDFVMEVEDHFDIEIPLNILSETRTMNDLVTVVQGAVEKRELV